MGDQAEKIKDHLHQVKREVILKDDVLYKLLGVRWYGEGMFLREEKLGKDIRAKKLYQVKAGDFVYNRLFAWKSSFAVVGKELDGCLVSNEFPAFTYKSEKTNPAFLLNYILQPNFIDHVNRLSGGMSSVSRKRFKEKAFLETDIPKYSEIEQNSIVDYFKCVESESAELTSEITHQQNLLKKLRQGILQEAIEGKLTADWRKQNPDVEPASKLLKRIQVEKEQLIKDKKIKNKKPLPPISEKEKPFELPMGWAWCRLGKIVSSANNGLYKQESFYREDGIASLRMYNIQDGRIAFNKVRRVNLTEDELNKYELLENDLLLNRVNSRELVGKTAIIRKGPEPLVYESMNMRLRLVHPMLSEYANRYLLGPPAREYFFNICKIASGQVSVNQGQVFNLIIPLPPLLEQKAIVAKVEKLFAICDQLEEQIATAKTHSKGLMQAVLKEAFHRGGTS